MMLYQKSIDQWNKDPILEAKEIVKTIAKELELGKVTFEKTTSTQYHPKKQAIIKIGDLVIGFVGALHPLILQNNKIGETSGVAYLSLNITAIVKSSTEASEHMYTYETLQDQIIWRDLCFVVDANKSFDTIITAVKKVPEVKEVEVFDVYTGKNLGDDKKSVSIKIKLVGDGNMTTEQINDGMKKAITAGESAGGSLRG
jgi:phenylalanyl-tRNA synthetase beta chain